MSAPSAGALKAGQIISKIVGSVPHFAEAIAKIIDRETASKELAEALRLFINACDSANPVELIAHISKAAGHARQALAKYEARQ